MPDAEIIKNALKYLVKLRIDKGEYGYSGDNPEDYVSWKYVLQILELMPCDKVAEYGLCGLCADQGGCGACVADTRKEMANDIFENMTDEERSKLWMYMIFNKDKIKERTEQLTKEAEKRGMTLNEYLESINPLNEENKIDVIKYVSAESEK